MDKIGELYHSKFAVSPRLSDQIILVEATQVTEQDLRDKIALAVDGQWEKKEIGWYLSPSPKAETARQKYLESIQRTILQNYFDKQIKDSDIANPYSTDFDRKAIKNHQANAARKNENEKYLPVANGFPSNRFLARFLQKFGVEKILAIKPGERVVFASQPNRMQVPIGFDVTQMIDEYHAEQAIQASVVKEFYGDKDAPKFDTNGKAIRTPGSFYYSSKIGLGKIQNVLFAVSCSTQGLYSFDLNCVPANLNELPLSFSCTPGLDGLFEVLSSAKGEDWKVPGEEFPDFKFSQASQDFYDFSLGKLEKIPADRQSTLLKEISDPAQHEPLRLCLSETLLADAHQLKRNIVAVLDDWKMLSDKPYGFDPSEALSPTSMGLAQIQPGWLIISPALDFSPPFPRKLWRPMIERGLKTKRLTLEDRAQIKAWFPRTQGVTPIEGLLEELAENADLETGNYDVLRVYGMMTETEFQQARQASGIRFGLLNPRLQRSLYELAFCSERNELQSTLPEDKQTGSIFETEPTLLAPNGFTEDTRLTITEVKSSIIYSDLGAYSPADFGRAIYRSTHQDEYSASRRTMEDLYPLDPARPLREGVQTIYKFQILLSPLCKWEGEMQKTVLSSDKSFKSDAMPSSLKAEFQAGYKAEAAGAAKRLEDVKRIKDQGTGKTPPPAGTL